MLTLLQTKISESLLVGYGASMNRKILAHGKFHQFLFLTNHMNFLSKNSLELQELHICEKQRLKSYTVVRGGEINKSQTGVVITDSL